MPSPQIVTSVGKAESFPEIEKNRCFDGQWVGTNFSEFRMTVIARNSFLEKEQLR